MIAVTSHLTKEFRFDVLDDQTLFTSKEFFGLLEKILRDMTRSTVYRLELIFDPQNNRIAYTNGKLVVVNTGHPICRHYAKQKTRFYFCVALLLHEIGHLLDGDLLKDYQKTMQSVRNRSLFIAAPASPSKLQMEVMSALKNPELTPLFVEVCKNLMNTGLDAHDEAAMANNFAAYVEYCFAIVHQAFEAEKQTLQQLRVQNASDWHVFFELMFAYIRFGHFIMEDTPQARKDPAYIFVQKCLPYLDVLRLSDSPIERRRALFDCLCQMWPMLKKDIYTQQSKSQKNGQQGMSWQQSSSGQGSDGSSESESDVSENEEPQEGDKTDKEKTSDNSSAFSSDASKDEDDGAASSSDDNAPDETNAESDGDEDYGNDEYDGDGADGSASEDDGESDEDDRGSSGSGSSGSDGEDESDDYDGDGDAGCNSEDDDDADDEDDRGSSGSGTSGSDGDDESDDYDGDGDAGCNSEDDDDSDDEDDRGSTGSGSSGSDGDDESDDYDGDGDAGSDSEDDGDADDEDDRGSSGSGSSGSDGDDESDDYGGDSDAGCNSEDDDDADDHGDRGYSDEFEDSSDEDDPDAPDETDDEEGFDEDDSASDSDGKDGGDDGQMDDGFDSQTELPDQQALGKILDDIRKAASRYEDDKPADVEGKSIKVGSDTRPIKKSPTNARAAEALTDEFSSQVTAAAREQQASATASDSIKESIRDIIINQDANSPHSGIRVKVDRPYTDSSYDVYLDILKEVSGYADRCATEVRQMFEEIREGTVLRGRRSGRVDTRALSRIATDQKIFFNRKAPNDEDEMAVCLLVDQSLSMTTVDSHCHRSRISVARTTAILLESFANAAGIKLMVCGHNGDGGSGIVFHVHKTFDTRTPDELSSLATMSTNHDNRDGLALHLAYEMLGQRPEQDKLLIIISDGKPNHANYGGDAAKRDIQSIVRLAQRKYNIETIAAAIGNDRDVIKNIYGQSYLDVTDLLSLPKTLTRLIREKIE